IKSFLIDLIQDLIYPLFRNIRRFFIRLGSGFIKQFLFDKHSFFWLIGVKEIGKPIPEIIHPFTPVIAPAERIHKQKPGEGTSQVSDMTPCIAGGNGRKIYDYIYSCDQPKWYTSGKHRENAIARRNKSVSHRNRHDTCGCT